MGLKIDDFGTGYSSLSNLCRLPIDTVKIDRSFVSDLVEGHDGLEIVKAVMRLAGGLHLNVIAEGVETQEQADLLRAMGCRYAQGFYFSQPVEIASAEKLLAGQGAFATPIPEVC